MIGFAAGLALDIAPPGSQPARRSTRWSSAWSARAAGSCSGRCDRSAAAGRLAVGSPSRPVRCCTRWSGCPSATRTSPGWRSGRCCRSRSSTTCCSAPSCCTWSSGSRYAGGRTAPGRLAGRAAPGAAARRLAAGAAGAVRDTGTGRSPRLRAPPRPQRGWSAAARPARAEPARGRTAAPAAAAAGGRHGGVRAARRPGPPGRPPEVRLRLGAPGAATGHRYRGQGLTGAAGQPGHGLTGGPTRLRGARWRAAPRRSAAVAPPEQRRRRLRLGSRAARAPWSAAAGWPRTWSGAQAPGARIGRGYVRDASSAGAGQCQARRRSSPG